MADDPKKRLFRLLGRKAKGTDEGAAEADLWLAHGRATGRIKEASLAIQRIASTLAQQRTAVDAVADRSRAAALRAQDLGASHARLADTFERLSLVALNAGLEGARLGEQAGHPLVLVSEEVRGHAQRGGETARELSSSLAEIAAELGSVGANLERAREASADVAQEAARASSAVTDGERALAEISDRLKATTGTDPETALAVREAEEHARALVATLGNLSGKVPRAFVARTLRPVLAPLLRLISEEDDGG